MYDLCILTPIKYHGSEPLLIQEICIEYLLCVRYWITVDFGVEEKITGAFLILLKSFVLIFCMGWDKKTQKTNNKSIDKFTSMDKNMKSL